MDYWWEEEAQSEPESHFATSCPFFTYLQPFVLVRFLALAASPN